MAQTKIWDGTKWVDYIMSSQIKLPLGSIGFSLDGILPEGAIAATGLELSREVYKDLWGFAQKGGETRLISEEAWQAELAANEGRFCRYYSTGNGATTFRIPYIACYLSGTAEAEKVGTYVTDTQRNITGTLLTTPQGGSPFSRNQTGIWIDKPETYVTTIPQSADNYSAQTAVDFDASRSVGAEPTGEEVKPKTAYVLYYIQAFSTIINSGTLDINDLVGDVSDLTLNHQIKSFTDLTQIGLTNGIEQLQDIGKNLPDNSQITYRVWEKDNHNHVIYPSISGIFTMEKTITFCRCFYNSIAPNKQWQMAFDYRDEFYIEPTWELLAKNNKLSMPSNNVITLVMADLNDTYVAPCDGFICARKIGTTAGTYVTVAINDVLQNSKYCQTLFYDYELVSQNLCGVLPVSKGQTCKFSYNGEAYIWFIPALNANSSVYGEDVRIYIQVVNSQGIVRGATVNISIGSEYTETGKTLTDGRYLLSYAGYNVLKTAESLNVEVTCEDGTTGQTQAPVGYFEDKINELQVLVS